MLKAGLASLIEKYGNTICVQGSDDAWKAIVQPLHYRNKLYVEETAVPAGMIDRTAFFYVGLPDRDLSAYPRGTLFVCDGQLLTVSHSETTYLADGETYVWAVFNRYGVLPPEEEPEEGTVTAS